MQIFAEYRKTKLYGNAAFTEMTLKNTSQVNTVKVFYRK